MVQCRTRERNDGTTYKICYGDKKTSEKTSPTKSSPNISIMNTGLIKSASTINTEIAIMNELIKILTDEPPSYLKRHGEMFVIRTSIGKKNKYLDDRTLKGTSIKIEERVAYKPRSAPISMLVMPKNSLNRMVRAGKKKGANFTFSLKKLEAGIADGSISIRKTKNIPTSDWASFRTIDGVVYRDTGTPYGITTEERNEEEMQGRRAGKLAKAKANADKPKPKKVKKSPKPKRATLTPPRRRPPQPKTPKGRPVNNIVRRAKTPPPYRAYTPIREGIPPRNRINLLGGNMIFDGWGEVDAFDSSIGGF